jgi:hypothetical protein
MALLLLAPLNMAFTFGSIGKKDWIPEDFNPRNGILLIREHPYNKSYNEGLLKFLKAEYPWKYEVVKGSELRENPKYDDKNTYHFSLKWETVSANVTETKGVGNDFTYSYKDLEGYFVDRITNKEYPHSGYGVNRGQSAYKKIIAVIVKEFEKEKSE